MRNPHHIHCGHDAPTGPGGVQLRLGTRADPCANVFLEIERLQLAVWRAIPAALLDLIEIASYVYAADQTFLRGGTGIPEEGELGTDWRRSIRFSIPVRRPELWERPDVQGALTSSLSFLSEDEYEFRFRALERKEPLQAKLQFDSTPYDGLIDEVMLFSGGLDSLSGAVQEILHNGRKVMLVHHRSTEKLAARHGSLLREVEHRAATNRPVHVPVWMNKRKALGREFTQRTRSFVYMAMAATLATMVGRDRICFYENGVVSLNLPLSAQVVGARATRTTHPAVLNGYARLVSLLLGKPFAVENPFLWETKTQIVERIAGAGCAPWIGRSTSCAHTWTRTNRHSHCGVCSQCIDRRFAVLAAGQERHDPADQYEVDLLTGERDEGENRQMLAGYLERANQLERMVPSRFFAAYGQASRILRQVPGSPDDVARKIYDLYRRHARDVNGVIDRGLADRAAEIRRRSLPANCLLRLVADAARAAPSAAPEAAPSTAAPSSAPPDEPNVFRKRGAAWEVRFEGGTPFILVPAKGASYLHRLLGRPGRTATGVELVCGEFRTQSGWGSGPKDAALDTEALAACRARLLELAEDRNRANDDENEVLAAEVDREVADLERLLATAMSPRGQARPLADARERFRKSVGNAIARTVKKIADFDPKLAAHFQGPALECGHSLRYCPSPEVRWATE